MTYSINHNNTTYTITQPSTSVSGASITYDYNNYNNVVWTTNNSATKNTLEVQGDANFHGDVKIQGKSIVDSLEKIEERLCILRPNEELEEKWEKLRDLRKAYVELEAEIKEKELIWATLKK